MLLGADKCQEEVGHDGVGQGLVAARAVSIDENRRTRARTSFTGLPVSLA